MSNRTQFANFDDNYSTKRNILCGVPQGSILGPLLYLIFVNDIATACDSNIFSFADDYNGFKGMFIIYAGGGGGGQIRGGGGAKSFTPLRGGWVMKFLRVGHEIFEGGQGGGGHKSLTLPAGRIFLARCALLHYT